MNGISHEELTKKLFDLDYDGVLANKLNISNKSSFREDMAIRNRTTDDFLDMEFVDVNAGRDDPHVSQKYCYDDDAHNSAKAIIGSIVINDDNMTAMNHFIDITKGKGRFDDYDGYSYKNGSGNKNQYEKQVGQYIDSAMAYWFNDEYVHAPGRKWYRNCSPALFRYSNVSSKEFINKYHELAKRFPLANSIGKEGKGVPYSVFMPVDNLGAFWYSHFLLSGDSSSLGSTLHAIQDACIPHHTSVHLGNYHRDYERSLGEFVIKYIKTNEFTEQVSSLYKEWSKNYSINRRMSLSRRNIRFYSPGINWSIEDMITWVAIKANYEYTNTYKYFKNYKRNDERSMKMLTNYAAAMSLLVLRKAALCYEAVPTTDKVNKVYIDITVSDIKNSDSNDKLILYAFNDENSGYIEVNLNNTKLEKGKTYLIEANLSSFNINQNTFKLAIATTGTDPLVLKSISIKYNTVADSNLKYYTNIERWPEYKNFTGNDYYCHTIPKKRVIANNSYATKLILKQKTKDVRNANNDTAKKFRLILQTDNNVYIIPFPSTNHDERERGKTDEYEFNISPYQVNIHDLMIGIYNNSEDGWLPSSFEIKLINEYNQFTSQFYKDWDNRWFDDNDDSTNSWHYIYKDVSERVLPLKSKILGGHRKPSIPHKPHRPINKIAKETD